LILGEEVSTQQEQTLRHSSAKQATKIRSIFGEHQLEQTSRRMPPDYSTRRTDNSTFR